MLSRVVCLNHMLPLLCYFVGERYIANETTLTCSGVSDVQPISDKSFKCYKKEPYIIQFDSGDRWVTPN